MEYVDSPDIPAIRYRQIKKALENTNAKRSLKITFETSRECNRTYRSLYMFYWRVGMRLRRKVDESGKIAHFWIEEA